MMRLQSQKGAVAPLIAVLLLVIVVCVAFVVDLGHVHNVKGELQRAVDAAALAGARYLPDPARVDAVAIATAAQNTVDNDEDEGVVVVPEDVILGVWDTENLTAVPSDRFTPTSINPNAVYVRATRNVDHAFFFFIESTQVTADAIALAKPLVPIIPLAMVSCVPTDEASHPPGTLPKMTLCGVLGHQFSVDPEDLAAWSSLTFGPASEQNILEILETDDGFDRFNQVVFGRGLDDTEGIENDPVSTTRPGSFSFNPGYDGCVNSDLNIDCGLGKIGDKEIAPPGDFSPPAGIPPLRTETFPATGKLYYAGDSSFDPLAGYNILPRWYNLSDNTGFDDADHFVRVISQDGILLRGPTETAADFETRMTALKDGVLRPYGVGDDRFLEGNFIDNGSRPDYLAVARHAGYPQVHVMNGVTKPVLEAFMMRLYGTEDKKDIEDPLPCSDNPPFPEGEKSVRINVPVIFAGNCENWKAVDSSDFTYIGMAKFLMTRAELVNVMYACPSGERAYAGACSETFTPPLDGAQEFGLVKFNSPALIEGVYTLPATDDEDDQGGLVEVLLVE